MREKRQATLFWHMQVCQDPKEKDTKGCRNSQMQSEHSTRQYWLRQFDWVYSQINKGDQSASSREDEDATGILVMSRIWINYKDFAAKYAAATADFHSLEQRVM